MDCRYTFYKYKYDFWAGAPKCVLQELGIVPFDVGNNLVRTMFTVEQSEYRGLMH
jgi:hypothetical protein